VYESEEKWRAVDQFFVSSLVREDAALLAARGDSAEAGLPNGEVAPNQGAMLAIFAQMVSARRILEIGTLGGYSTIWLGRALLPGGMLVSLEIDPHAADLARRNIHAAGLDAVASVVLGPALESLHAFIEQGVDPFDLVFIDADKPNNPGYLSAALRLTRPGSVIVVDNVVRNGAVLDLTSTDANVQGVRTLMQMLYDEPRLRATALQTVGSKGWDGFALAVVQ
jgi:predicted O-methyltransferase YrrM